MHKVRPSTNATPQDADSFEVGHLIDNRYRIQKYLGKGASSRVYVADDTALQTTVALKVLRQSVNNARTLLRFEQEARVSLALSHPNVCRVFGFGRLPDERGYLVMEFLEGVTLHALLRKRGKLQASHAYAVVQQLLSALHESHRHGIVHRDVKPSNILLVPEEGSVGRVKLLDFGLAKAPVNLAVIHTRPGHACGTPGYAAPELLSGGGADHHCDLWSAGVILFELLAGVRPFRDPPPGASPFTAVCGPIRNFRDYVPDASDELVDLIEVALEKDPARRISSADEFSRRLSGIIDELGPPSTAISLESTESLFPRLENDPSIPSLNRTPIQSLPPVVNSDTEPPSTASITTVDSPAPS
jgi:serine/threonine-protein kinase